MHPARAVYRLATKDKSTRNSVRFTCKKCDFCVSVYPDAAYANAVLENIMLQLCYVRDYRGAMQQFIKCEEIELKSCCEKLVTHAPITYQYPIVIRGLRQEIGGGIQIPGIVLSVDDYVLPTDDLICDALLGDGEALDCYNIRLQEAAVDKAQLDNLRTEQMIRIIDSIDDPKGKAELYKKVFGVCCEVPQSGCSCHACQEAHAEPK